MTLLEFIRKLQTPDGRVECAAMYGGCLEYIEKMEAQNREMHNQIIENGEHEEMASADLDESRKLIESLKKTIAELESEKSDLWKRLDKTSIELAERICNLERRLAAAQLAAKMLNAENEAMRNYGDSKTKIIFDLELENKELKDKLDLTTKGL